MGEDGKVVNTLQHRWAVEQGLVALRDAESPQEISEALDGLRNLPPGEVISGLVRHLGTDDPAWRARLGMLTRFLPRQAAVSRLQQAAANPTLGDQARATALMILERYLEVVPDASLMSGFGSPEGVARQSIWEALRQSEEDPLVWLDYVSQLLEQPPEVIALMERMLAAENDPRLVEPLRLLAMEKDAPVAQEALRLLGQLRFAEAASALRSLIPNLAPSRRKAAERGLQKLMLRGIRPDVRVPDEKWRALVSPMDSLGKRVIWFVDEGTNPAEPELFLGLLIEEHRGVVEAIGGAGQRLGEGFPRRGTVGEVRLVSLLPEDVYIPLLEAEHAYALWLLAKALSWNFESGFPLPPLYKFYSNRVWLWNLPEYRSKLSPMTGSEAQALRSHTPRLLEHIGLINWFMMDEALYVLAWEHREEPLRGALPQSLRSALREWLDGYLSPDMLARFEERLRDLAEWLANAGETELSRLALASSILTTEESYAPLPFFQALAERSFRAIHRRFLADAAQEKEERPSGGSMDNAQT